MTKLLDSFWRAAMYCLHPRVVALSFLPLIPMQLAVNEINERVAPAAGTNEHFSGENYIAMLAGSGVLVWIVAGMFHD